MPGKAHSQGSDGIKFTNDRIRKIVIAAVRAARNGFPPEPGIAQAIATGSREITIDRLEFDSLAWMEFCISIELQSRQELTPADIEGMRYVAEIEDWLRAEHELVRHYA